jgi:hypothetical protein
LTIIDNFANNPSGKSLRKTRRFHASTGKVGPRPALHSGARSNSSTETWSRADIENLFNVGRATAQSLTRAIGKVQTVAGAHFVHRSNLLEFLNALIEAPPVEETLRARLQNAHAPPRRRSLKVPLPQDLKSATVRDLPDRLGKVVATIDPTPPILAIQFGA